MLQVIDSRSPFSCFESGVIAGPFGPAADSLEL